MDNTAGDYKYAALHRVFAVTYRSILPYCFVAAYAPSAHTARASGYWWRWQGGLPPCRHQYALLPPAICHVQTCYSTSLLANTRAAIYILFNRPNANTIAIRNGRFLILWRACIFGRMHPVVIAGLPYDKTWAAIIVGQYIFCRLRI